MSAVELRQAAATLRERANKAADGPWRAYDNEVLDSCQDAHRVADTVDAVDGRYIATTHPGVGLALADWLDESALGMMHTTYGRDLTPAEHKALAVARLINGSQG